MASMDQNRLLEVLEDRLKSSVVDLTSEGSAEFAFPVSCARDVYESLADAGLLVLGGDLWRAEKDGYSSCAEGWFIASSSEAPSVSRFDTSRQKWNEFIDKLPDRADFYVTFVI